MDTNKSSSRLDSGKPKKNMECIDLTYKSNVSCTIEPFFQTDLHHLPEMLHLVNDTGCMPIVPGCCASYKSHPLALRKRQLHRHQPSEFTISGLTLNVHFELWDTISTAPKAQNGQGSPSMHFSSWYPFIHLHLNIKSVAVGSSYNLVIF